MAKKITGPQMIVANRLLDGRVVFMRTDGSWSTVAGDAGTAEDEAGVAALETLAQKSAHANEVLSIEVIQATTRDGKPFPAHMKFAMQATGPSVRTDLGYQVSPNWER
ncbi:DUF2849 domain-containing protein [Kordiimonas sp.]|uniref:DUF2849 domain-containing protein n=1 Tax=Kordiimonas sp. TaxID=1970157 RepID=UPI003A8E8643